MHSIRKVTLAITDMQVTDVPRGSVALAVQFQRGVLCLWFRADSTQPYVTQRIALMGTGNPADHVASWAYLGTVQQFDGQLTWHVFVEPITQVGSPEPTHHQETR